jgi:hypothetical protein
MIAAMDGDRSDRVRQALESFRQRFCHLTMQPLTVVHASDRRWTDAEYRNRRPKGFPTKLRGVYLIYDDAQVLQYVGLAMGCFDKRVWSHDDLIPRRQFIDIVSFDDAWLPLAPTLEFWLIQTLRPPINTTYQDYGVHDPIPSPANDAKA